MKRWAWIMALIFMPQNKTFAQEMKTSIYGYINSYFEKVDDEPQIGTSEKASNPISYDVPDIHFITQSSYGANFKSFLNIKAPGADDVVISTAWVDGALAGDLLRFRLGKLYRPFGLYNEILDAVPTYIGIEPPELFDGDHLLLTRTTNVMFHGGLPAGPGYIKYALTTGNDERADDELPIGLDVHFVDGIRWKFGVSYYNSGGDARANNYDENGAVVSEEVGASDGGVLPWMDADKYSVMGVYAQYMGMGWTVQAAYYNASHDATRNNAAVTELCGETLNSRQRENFGCNTSNILETEYDVTTYYARVGYTFDTEFGDVTPYGQYDFYENPETIANKKHGGDKEAGVSDDGEFVKLTAGVVYNPVVPVALKLDYSQHLQDVNGESEPYGEFRFSFSYYFRL